VAYRHTGGTLFVGPHQRQYLRDEATSFVQAASSRPLASSILRHERTTTGRPVFLVQDNGDGANFAHFTFDWLTRVMHAMQTGIADEDALFIMGGVPGDYQNLLVQALMRMYRLKPLNFFFPIRRILIDVTSSFTYFSDQKAAPLHPAQMAHPASIARLASLCAELDIPPGTTDRLYVSRRDAKLRRVANEDTLIGIAQQKGFRIVEMSGLTIENQIALVKGARFIAGPHGMGMTNLVFSPGPLSILELFHPAMGTDAYAIMARAMGFSHAFLVGTAIDDNRGSYGIDENRFADALDDMMA
jgi:capsular polysaccharide biosynthesis protein